MQVNEELRLAIVRARSERGWSQKALADRAETTQQTVARIESGEVLVSRAVPKILAELNLQSQSAQSSGNEQANPILFAGRLVGERDLPVHSAAEGGAGMFTVSKEPIERAVRPSPLIGVKDGYGIYVVGESMRPAYRPGDLALVHPHLPPRSDDDVVLYGPGKPGERPASLKTFRGMTLSHWLLIQWNPPDGETADIELPRDEWPVCHVIVGNYRRR